MLWEIDIYPAPGQPDLAARKIAVQAADLGLAQQLTIASANGYLIEGPLDRQQAQRAAAELLSDSVVETAVVAPVGDAALLQPPPRHAAGGPRAAQAGRDGPRRAERAGGDRRSWLPVEAVRTLQKYWLGDLPPEQLQDALLARCWPTTPSSRSSSARCRSTGWSSARAYRVQAASPCRCASWTTTA